MNSSFGAAIADIAASLKRIADALEAAEQRAQKHWLDPSHYVAKQRKMERLHHKIARGDPRFPNLTSRAMNPSIHFPHALLEAIAECTDPVAVCDHLLDSPVLLDRLSDLEPSPLQHELAALETQIAARTAEPNDVVLLKR